MKTLDLFHLNGKIALVTGCKRGIGKAMAIALAEAGADIIGVSANLEPSGSEVEQEILATGRKFYSYQCDFSKRDALNAFIKKVKEEHPKIDILINNAGTILRKPIAEHPDEYWDEVIAINQTAPFILTREIGKEMLKREEGKIIFIGSLLSFQGGINVPGYAASKGAIGQLTKAFANEWASKGVNVNGIVPGYISTDNTTALRSDEDRSNSILERIPANRWGNPEDFKGPIVFLCSNAANYLHGTLVAVDGGWMGR
ncbi:SDR family NAD(P)-dependent oxidoreductase [Flavobacterium sp. WC2509]|uniref:SDR family NAD(P)-dependent oxidoreductase n=1 Tax=Flavobacterium sp. WC2509 TaxID=3461406 RepID=UPI0040441EF1